MVECTAILETLSAERDATSEEMNQIKQAKEALTSREKGLEAESKDRKKRIQELNAPKSDPIWPMLFGSALTFGVIVSLFRDQGYVRPTQVLSLCILDVDVQRWAHHLSNSV